MSPQKECGIRLSLKWEFHAHMGLETKIAPHPSILGCMLFPGGAIQLGWSDPLRHNLKFMTITFLDTKPSIYIFFLSFEIVKITKTMPFFS